MPLVIITGIPCAGKTTRAMQLKQYFEEQKGKRVEIVSEMQAIEKASYDRNTFYADSKKEKAIRSDIKSTVQRILNTNDVLIIDGSNYIKGYRYEIYCMTKLYKTPQCTIHCDAPVEHAWLLNGKRPDGQQYTRDTFDALVMRYEPPESRNRWDSPLFAVCPEDELQFDDIYKALYETNAPKPNLSTQSPRLLPTNYLGELEKQTAEVVEAISFAKNLGVDTEFRIPDTNLRVQGPFTQPQLFRLKKQFISYSKMQQLNVNQIKALFVQYLNKTS